VAVKGVLVISKVGKYGMGWIRKHVKIDEEHAASV
jgi:hypothetical protein